MHQITLLPYPLNLHLLGSKTRALWQQRAIFILTNAMEKKIHSFRFENHNYRPTLPPNGKKLNHIIFQVGTRFFKIHAKFWSDCFLWKHYITIELGCRVKLIRHIGNTKWLPNIETVWFLLLHRSAIYESQNSLSYLLRCTLNIFKGQLALVCP